MKTKEKIKEFVTLLEITDRVSMTFVGKKTICAYDHLSGSKLKFNIDEICPRLAVETIAKLEFSTGKEEGYEKGRKDQSIEISKTMTTFWRIRNPNANTGK